MRTRKNAQSNYQSVFTDNYETYRWRIDPALPITKLQHPEIIDISLGTFCDAGCSYCYVSATKKGILYDGVVHQINEYFGSLDADDRPYQVAIGGDGEPCFHHRLLDVVRAFRDLGIVPNITTNGTVMSDQVRAAAALCGGIAITAHDHIEWIDGVEYFSEVAGRINIHVVVGELGSAQKCEKIASLFNGNKFPLIERVVMLPLQFTGFASKLQRTREYDQELKLCIDLIASDPDKFAIGALFDNYFSRYPEEAKRSKVSLYDHEMFSGFMRLNKSYKLYKSSYKIEER